MSINWFGGRDPEAQLCREALQTGMAVVAGNVCVRECVCVSACLGETQRECVRCVSECVCVCSALRGGRLRLSQREVGRLATR